VSLFKFTGALLVFSFLFSFALFAFEDRLVVPTFAKKVALENQLLGREKSLDANRIVVISNQGDVVYKADYYDDAEETLSGLYIVIRNADKTLRAILRAASARWESGLWLLDDPTLYTQREGTLDMGSLIDPDIEASLTEPPETFRNNTMSVEEVNVVQAKTYISKLQRTGLPVAEAQSQYYKKFSFPFVVFMSIGLSGKTRKNVLIISLMLCVLSAVAFYILQMVTMLLAKFGTIPPLAGAWFPVIFFTAISAVLMRFAKT
jgi:lipopolysaccharide export system permease protein